VANLFNKFNFATWRSTIAFRQPASSYLICSLGHEVAVYLCAFARRNQPARTTASRSAVPWEEEQGDPVILSTRNDA
jgi:hypothetical protein